jgi:DNA adenine methylase
MARRRPLNHDTPLRPPLKWAGGKRWLAPALKAIYRPHRRKRLVEPFCGGLAVALALDPEEALLNDVNPHPVNFYQHLQRGLSTRISMRNDRELYYAHREDFNRLVTGRGSATAKAAQLFYFLNRTGYNGLCRFNSRGEFNVPFGRYAKIGYRRDFHEYQPVLSRWQFQHGDFADLTLGPNDFIYADPPYDQTFSQYAAGGFNWEEQKRLAHWLAEHPGPVVLSNQATDRIRRLYRKLGFTIATLDAPRTISCNGDRTKAREVLATRNLSPAITTAHLRRLL